MAARPQTLTISRSPPKTLVIDLRVGCLTQNYWQEVLQPFMAQSLPTFLFDRWHSSEFRKNFAPIGKSLFANQCTAMHPPDLIAYSEKLVSCIQSDRWPRGIEMLLSQIVSLGVGTNYLKAQLYADTINSFRRWQQLGWRIITLSEFSSLTQRQLLQNTQVGDLGDFVQHTLPLSIKLPRLEHCTIISARSDVLEKGKAAGYKTLWLNRAANSSAPEQHPRQNKTHAPQIVEMDLIDLFLGD